MIEKTIDLNTTLLMLPKIVKFTKKTSDELLQKIKAKKEEPFGKIKLIVLPFIFEDLAKMLKRENIQVQSIQTDKGKILLEI